MRAACGRPVVVLPARERPGRDQESPARDSSAVMHTWGAGAGCPGRRPPRVLAATPRSGVRRMATHVNGSFSSTSQSTSWSSSSRRNERVRHRASSARCASADVLTEGNMCSQARNGSGRTLSKVSLLSRRVRKTRTAEPFSGPGSCKEPFICHGSGDPLSRPRSAVEAAPPTLLPAPGSAVRRAPYAAPSFPV
jgi:hypothetical protein